VRDTILLRNLQSFDEAARPLVLNFVMKFQQLTGPVMAKSVEDTAFYIYNRLVSLNEVGGHPEQFGSTIEMFHRDNTNRLRRWPHAMLATSTHDTKRGEDTRARINVLSEIPQEWETALEGWNRIAIRHKTPAGGEPAPDRNEEYLLYQILLGAWLDKPDDDFRQRITDYMIKAANEAKVHTSWINPDEEYSTSIQKFVAGMLRDPKFLNAFRPVQQRVAFYGLFNSISQTLLKLTAPGMPDIYQGSELWNFSLVDPDNRRPVDYKQRRTMLSALKKRMGDRLPLVRDLLEHRTDGRIKLYLTHVALQFRQEHEPLFSTGDYLPLAVEGSKKKHVVAFARVLENDAVIVVVPRLFVDLTGRTERLPLGSDIWQDTRVILPPEWDKRNYQNLFTGEVFSPTQAGTLSTLMNHFPAVLLKPVS
jgi:(1->4)-alpha-D-glucan 1-alpha-D-glucosylmutase